MDLLGGYGSSSDEEEVDRVEQRAAAPRMSQTSATEPGEPNETAVNRKGRKILSLASVLPQHILDQLTKSQVQGDDAIDSDDDEVDNERQTGRETQKTNSRNESHAQQHPGISSFLSDLKAAPTVTTTNSKAATKNGPAPSLASQRERMGAAFLQSTVVVETVKEDSASIVRDIHAQNDEDNPAVKVVPDSTTVKSPPAVANHSSRSSNSAVSAAEVHRPTVTAAPSLASYKITDSAATPAAFHDPNQNSVNYHQGPTAAAAHTQDCDTSEMGDDRASRKRSRKEMERALRQGNLSEALQGCTNVAKIEQAQPDAYVPEPETYAVPSHGIKVVPTAMYDPKAGQAVTSASGKGRGKNQLHHLMASAANLELQRARGLGAGANAGRSHRANAKQKYGW